MNGWNVAPREPPLKVKTSPSSKLVGRTGVAEKLLSFGIKLRITKWLRSRASLILVVLVAQASVASAVHHHPFSTPPASESSFSSPDDASKTGTPSSSERDCPTCRLQRTFASALGVPAVVFLVESRPLIRETYSRQNYLFNASFFLSNRGPPQL